MNGSTGHIREDTYARLNATAVVVQRYRTRFLRGLNVLCAWREILFHHSSAALLFSRDQTRTCLVFLVQSRCHARHDRHFPCPVSDSFFSSFASETAFVGLIRHIRYLLRHDFSWRRNLGVSCAPLFGHRQSAFHHIPTVLGGNSISSSWRGSQMVSFGHETRRTSS